jgi:23S rRNA (guanosine2251-2'-O)-methyltransferase
MLKPEKYEILFGIHPVIEALNATRRNFFEVYLQDKKVSKRLDRIIRLADARNIPVEKVKSPIFRSMVGNFVHQGIAARVSPYPYADLEDILMLEKSANSDKWLLLLDGIQDPHNLGAIIRTAVCVGMTGVVIPKDRSVSPTPAVSRVSAGALEHVKLVRVNNIVRTVMMLKEIGFWIVGTDQHAHQSIYASDLTGATAFVIGGEEKGMRPLVKRNCDTLISVPQVGAIHSLNASVAAAVVMYESLRQRQAL